MTKLYQLLLTLALCMATLTAQSFEVATYNNTTQATPPTSPLSFGPPLAAPQGKGPGERAMQPKGPELLFLSSNQEGEKVYAVKPFLEGGLGIAGLATTTYFFQTINDKGSFDASMLNREDIPSVDRWILPDNSDKVEKASNSSDMGFYPSIALPFTLFFSKKIRKDWFDITAMYLEAQAINGIIYAVSPLGPNFSDRRRPQAYMTDVSLDSRGDEGNLNSFFSGHVSTTATGTFFFAKVLSDYNPQWTGGQKALLYGAAALPPLFVGVQRIRALRHFPTDVAVGYGIGTLVGILTPAIHKRWQAKHRTQLSIGGGYGDGAGGVGFSLVF